MTREPDREQLLSAVLREDLCAFTELCHAGLLQGGAIKANWHIELLCARLEAVARGEIRRLVINLPPRHLKSLVGSVAFPAWVLGRDPTRQIICVSYAQDLADKLARDCHAVMLSPRYQALFPTRLSRGRSAVSDFSTTQGGFRMATSIGGVLTGRGADLIIIDDPVKPDDALSDVRRKAANQWFENTLLSRLNDKLTGAIIIIMQRLHEDDLTGHVQEQGGWEVLRLPAIAETDEAFSAVTPFGPRSFTRKAGEALHPEREPLALLERMRSLMGAFSFSAQYQQSPVPLEGGLLKRNWLRAYAPSTTPTTFDLVLQSWDTANKATELSDYSVCTTWGVAGERFYLLDVLRERLDYPSLKRAARLGAERFRPGVVLIEDKASGTQLIQELRVEGLHAVTAYDPGAGDKVMRFHAQTSAFEGGFVFLPDRAPWLDAYVHELTTFPFARHDDQADSTAQALHWFRNRPATPNIITYYQQLLEKEGISVG